MYDLIVVGAGPAGMMAGGTAASRGLKVLVIERMKQEGSKILVTGKGRCNITNDCEVDEFLEKVMSNKSFLYSSLYTFPPSSVIEFFNKLGVPTVTERGRRVFPKSEKAKDVRDALVSYMKSNKVQVLKDSKVSHVFKKEDGLFSVNVQDKDGKKSTILSKNLLLATGGMSYSSTGSDGYGYKLAKSLGHEITPLMASLTGLYTKEKWPQKVMGLTLKNVGLSLTKDDKVIYKDLGEMLFTHFGISGPLVLTGSSYLLDYGYENVLAHIDLKPGLTKEQLYKRITSDFSENGKKSFSSSLRALLPESLIPIIVDKSKIPGDKQVSQINKEEKNNLVDLLKDLSLGIKKAMDIEDAVVTKGGVSTKEIDSSTMESKLCKGLYFAGEIIDVDGLTGGYNLTIAFSTAYLAGQSVRI